MPAWLIPILSQLIPLLLAALAPLITGAAEQLSATAGKTLPNGAKPVLNVGAGIALASTVTDPQMAVIMGPIGALIGNRIREAMNKDKAPQKPGA